MAPISTTCSGRSSAAAAATTLIAAYNKTIIYDPPRQLDLFGSAAVYTGLERLPNAQNIASPKNIASLEVGAKYTNTRKALGGVDHEKGIAWRALADLDYAQGNAFPEDLRRGRLWRAAAAAEQLDLDLRATPATAGGKRGQPARRFLLRLVPQQLCR